MLPRPTAYLIFTDIHAIAAIRSPEKYENLAEGFRDIFAVINSYNYYTCTLPYHKWQYLHYGILLVCRLQGVSHVLYIL